MSPLAPQEPRKTLQLVGGMPVGLIETRDGREVHTAVQVHREVSKEQESIWRVLDINQVIKRVIWTTRLEVQGIE